MMTRHGGKGTGKLTSGCTAATPSFGALLALLLIMGAPLGSVFAQQSQKDFEPLEKAALDELRKTNTPGAAVAVVSGGRINKTGRWMFETAEKGMEIMLPLDAEAEALKQSLPERGGKSKLRR